ncbi:hypothetical protein ACP70R_046893 [Stipagrostis hirtigluma subsp. patula]
MIRTSSAGSLLPLEYVHQKKFTSTWLPHHNLIHQHKVADLSQAIYLLFCRPPGNTRLYYRGFKHLLGGYSDKLYQLEKEQDATLRTSLRAVWFSANPAVRTESLPSNGQGVQAQK